MYKTLILLVAFGLLSSVGQAVAQTSNDTYMRQCMNNEVSLAGDKCEMIYPSSSRYDSWVNGSYLENEIGNKCCFSKKGKKLSWRKSRKCFNNWIRKVREFTVFTSLFRTQLIAEIKESRSLKCDYLYEN